MKIRDPDEFCIKIDFQRDSESPARVFKAMTGLIEAFEKLDRQLVKSVDVNIEPMLLLEDIETGSIKAWLRTRIADLDDKDIRNLNWKAAIGVYLVKAKYIVVDFLADKTEISNRSELQTLQQHLLQAAEDTNMKQIPAYAPLALPAVIESIQSLSAALVHLNSKDQAIYIAGEQQTDFNLNFKVSPETWEQLITKETITNEVEMILKVKRPDYLGDVMWEFRHGQRPISAKINDDTWLARFQSRDVDVRPGDAIRARVRVEVEYGFDGEVVATHYLVTEVLAVVPASESLQVTLIPKDATT